MGATPQGNTEMFDLAVVTESEKVESVKSKKVLKKGKQPITELGAKGLLCGAGDEQRGRKRTSRAPRVLVVTKGSASGSDGQPAAKRLSA